MSKKQGTQQSLDLQSPLNFMTSILNKSDVMICVTDPNTHEILFMNEKMMQHFGLDGDAIGKFCYKVLQKGQTGRCDFCPCHQLDKEPDKVIVWEDHNSMTKKFYRRSDQYTDWPGGKKAHIQYCIDITDLKQTAEALKNRDVMLDALNKTAIMFLSRNEDSF